jgi:hypothetical protein
MNGHEQQQETLVPVEFCLACASTHCPHARPGRYTAHEAKRYFMELRPGRSLEEALQEPGFLGALVVDGILEKD